jgi:hypothetical protein
MLKTIIGEVGRAVEHDQRKDHLLERNPIHGDAVFLSVLSDACFLEIGLGVKTWLTASPAIPVWIRSEMSRTLRLASIFSPELRHDIGPARRCAARRG